MVILYRHRLPPPPPPLPSLSLSNTHENDTHSQKWLWNVNDDNNDNDTDNTALDSIHLIFAAFTQLLLLIFYHFCIMFAKMWIAQCEYTHTHTREHFNKVAEPQQPYDSLLGSDFWNFCFTLHCFRRRCFFFLVLRHLSTTSTPCSYLFGSIFFFFLILNQA